MIDRQYIECTNKTGIHYFGNGDRCQHCNAEVARIAALKLADKVLPAGQVREMSEGGMRTTSILTVVIPELMSGTRLYDGWETGTNVYIEYSDEDNEYFAYGTVAAGPLEADDVINGFAGFILTAPNADDVREDLLYLEAELAPVSGCECGNPFILCHPEA